MSFFQVINKCVQKSFSIVEFIDESDDDGKELINLIPTAWINKNVSPLTCFYPKRSSKKLLAMIENLSNPLSTWLEYPIIVLKREGKFFYLIVKKFYTELFSIILLFNPLKHSETTVSHL